MRNGIWRGVGFTFTGTYQPAGNLVPVPDVIPVTEEPPPPETTSPPTFVGTQGATAGTGAIRPTWVVGHVAGDIGLMFVESANDVAVLLDAQGFVEVTGSPVGTGTASGVSSTRLHVYWCRATSNTMGSPQVGYATSGNHLIGRILVFRGCVTTGNPWDVTASDVLAAASASVTIPGLTTTLDQCLIVAALAWATDSLGPETSGWINASLTDLTERADSGTGSGNGGGLSIATGIKAALGVVSATTATQVTSTVQARMAIALKPQPGVVVPPPPPPDTGFRTMVGAFSVPTALRGWTSPPFTGAPLKPTPDVKFSHNNGSAYVGPNGYIQHARDHGYCFCAQVSSSSDDWADPSTGDFSESRWNGFFDIWADGIDAQEPWDNGTYSYTGGADELSKAVKDGILRFIMVIDDFIAPRGSGQNGFTHAVPYEPIEAICQHAKARYAYLPCVARGVNTYLLSAATLNGVIRQYHYLDAGWAQWRSSHDSPRTPTGTLADYTARAVAYLNAQVSAGEQCGLGLVGGANILNRGDGQDPTWGYVQGDNPPPSPGGMSPNEIKAIGLSVMANPKIAGWVIWAYDGQGAIGDTYYNLSDILAALTVVYNASIGRIEPPLNIRAAPWHLPAAA